MEPFFFGVSRFFELVGAGIGNLDTFFVDDSDVLDDAAEILLEQNQFSMQLRFVDQAAEAAAFGEKLDVVEPLV